MIERKTWYWEKYGRYYRISLQKDLWGKWYLVRNWGGINSNRGGIKIESYDTVQELDDAIAGVFKRRKIRGYQLVKK